MKPDAIVVNMAKKKRERIVRQGSEQRDEADDLNTGDVECVL